MGKIIITLGAGHGGTDPGAIGPTGLREKDVTLAIVLYARYWLNAYAADKLDVHLLRTADVYIGVDNRPVLAAQLHSQCHVEVHANAFDRKASYAMVLRSVHHPDDATAATQLCAAMASILGVASSKNQITMSSDNANDYYGVIRDAASAGIPHILYSEGGFIDYAPTEAKLRLPAIQNALGQAIAKTVCGVFSIPAQVPTPTPTTETAPAFPGADKFGKGKSNNYVTQLGIRLVLKGFGKHYKTGPGPTWGEADRLNCQEFQLAQGWSGSNADGIPGPVTWVKLFK